METTLVTCIYDNLHNTKFGGRLNRGSMYIESLKIIANTNLQIYCFTSRNEYAGLKQAFKNYSNIHLMIFDLVEYKNHKQIQLIKDEIIDSFDIFWKNRCAEIMYSKFDMIISVINQQKLSGNVYWIDAGLSRAEILSYKFFNADDIENHRYYNAVKLFTPELFNKINSFTDNKLLLIESTRPHNGPIPSIFVKNSYVNKNAPIGGLLGGNIDILQNFIKLFKEKEDNILNNKMLFSEESILAGVKADFDQSLLKIFEFDSWYHEYWKDFYDQSLINFSHFFDIIDYSIYTDISIPSHLETSPEQNIINPIFCTLAIGEKYRNLSKILIKSFRNYNQNIPFLIITDDKDFYKSFDNVHVYEVHHLNTAHFLYNNKLLSIKKAFETFETNTIVYLDADCYFKDFDLEYLSNISNGLNVNFNIQHTESFINNIIRDKIRFVNKHYNLDNFNRIFKEQTLIFKIYDTNIFNNFLNKWLEISNMLTVNGLTHNTECSDISAAAYLTNFNIESIDHKLYELKASIFTTILETEARTLI